MKSKIGLALVTIFLVITVTLDIKAAGCGQMFCGLPAVFSAMPWLFTDLISQSHAWGLYIYQGLNAVIVYFIGVGISKLIAK